jgi:DNA-binding response OmpR family regulator
MKTDRRDSIRDSLRRLIEAHDAAMRLLERSYQLLSEEFAPDLAERLGRPALPDPADDHFRPVIDPSRFTVAFRGRACRLGNTIPFRFLARLAETPERYVPHQQLIDDLWDGVCSDDALRSVVKNLRRRLRDGGLGELADAIDGLTPGHYALVLGRG